MAIYIDDRQLVDAHRSGDIQAFEELVREHKDSLIGHAMRKLSCDTSAEDALQETLIRAHRALPRFDGEYRLGPWLHRIMENVCVDELNRRTRDFKKFDRVATLEPTVTSSPSPEDELGLNTNHESLNSAIDELGSSYRDAIIGRFVEDLSYDQIASQTGISEQNVRRRVSRARATLRTTLKGVAAFPMLVWGLVRKSEQVAAATSSTSALPLSTATQGVSSGAIPTLAEAAIATSGTALVGVPVVAKAAVSFGLVAAVFAPASDSAVHQALEDIGVKSAAIVVDSEQLVDNLPPTAIVITSAVSENINVQPASVPSLSIAVESEVTENSDALNSTAMVESAGSSDSRVVESLSAMSTNSLVVETAGPGRYKLSGVVNLNISGKIYEGVLDSTSRFSIASQQDSDGRKRIDGILVVELEDKSSLELRIAGFGNEVGTEMQIAGLYRAETYISELSSSQGSFSGAITMGDANNASSLSLAFVS